MLTSGFLIAIQEILPILGPAQLPIFLRQQNQFSASQRILPSAQEMSVVEIEVITHRLRFASDYCHSVKMKVELQEPADRNFASQTFSLNINKKSVFSGVGSSWIIQSNKMFPFPLETKVRRKFAMQFCCCADEAKRQKTFCRHFLLHRSFAPHSKTFIKM